MLKISGCFTDKLSIVRRLVFASAVLPQDTPQFWEIVSSFANSSEGGSSSSTTTKLTPQGAKTYIENLQYLDPDSLKSDQDLTAELQSFIGHKGIALGLVLVSPKQTCRLCGSALLVKADRPSRVTVYSDSFGTVEGTHYRKVCKRFRVGCQFVQHYGHYSKGGTDIYFDEDFKCLPYFVSTRETAFETTLLQQLDAEVLIGQLSYKQRSEIYNIKHGYDKPQKKVPKKKVAADSTSGRMPLHARLAKKYILGIATWFNRALS